MARRGTHATQKAPTGSDRSDKVCPACGRRIEWRKKWERDWDSVRYCSTSCRKRGVRAEDRALEERILALLARRAPGASICPSEAARAVYAERAASDDPEGWRALMEPARRAARRLVAAGKAEITQKGKPVDPSSARGPIRVRRVAG